MESLNSRIDSQPSQEKTNGFSSVKLQELSQDKSDKLKTLESEQKKLENQLANLEESFSSSAEGSSWLNENFDKALKIKLKLIDIKHKIISLKKELGIDEKTGYNSNK